MSNEQPQDILVVEIDLRWVWQLVDEVSLGLTGRALVISSEGRNIAHPDRSFIDLQADPGLLTVLAGYEGKTEYDDPFSGEIMLASYSPIGKQSGFSKNLLEANGGQIEVESQIGAGTVFSLHLPVYEDKT